MSLLYLATAILVLLAALCVLLLFYPRRRKVMRNTLAVALALGAVGAVVLTARVSWEHTVPDRILRDYEGSGYFYIYTDGEKGRYFAREKPDGSVVGFYFPFTKSDLFPFELYKSESIAVSELAETTADPARYAEYLKQVGIDLRSVNQTDAEKIKGLGVVYSDDNETVKNGFAVYYRRYFGVITSEGKPTLAESDLLLNSWIVGIGSSRWFVTFDLLRGENGASQSFSDIVRLP